MTRKRSCDHHPRYRAGCAACNMRSNRYQTWVALVGLPLTEPAEPIRQMVRELRAAGYPLPVLAAETGLHGRQVYRLSVGCDSWVQLRTANAVRAAYVRLKDFHGPDRRAALWARKHGWTPPAVEDLPPVIDTVAIDRALTGERTPLTPEERAAAVREAGQRGLSPYQIAELLGMNGDRVKAYLAGVQPKKRGRKRAA